MSTRYLNPFSLGKATGEQVLSQSLNWHNDTDSEVAAQAGTTEKNLYGHRGAQC